MMHNTDSAIRGFIRIGSHGVFGPEHLLLQRDNEAT
jgi:hypothetical protein